MPKTEMNYNQLLALRDDILHHQRTSASFYYFNRARVERFFSQNTFQLHLLKTRMEEFVSKYVKHDENGQPLTEEREGTLHYLFNTEEDKEKYSAAIQNFLNIKTNIEL